MVITSALPNIDWQSRLRLPGLIHFRIFLLLGWLAVTILKKKVASSSLAETNFLIFNFSFSSLETKNYVRKTDMCFVFLGKDPTGKKFFCKVIWLSKLLSTFQFGVVWAMNSLFTATLMFLSAYESDSLTLPVNKSPVVLFSYAHSKIPKEKTEGLRRRLSEEGYYG